MLIWFDRLKLASSWKINYLFYTLSLSLSLFFISYGKVEAIRSQHQECKRICMGYVNLRDHLAKYVTYCLNLLLKKTHICISSHENNPKFLDKKLSIKPYYEFLSQRRNLLVSPRLGEFPQLCPLFIIDQISRRPIKFSCVTISKNLHSIYNNMSFIWNHPIW